MTGTDLNIDLAEDPSNPRFQLAFKSLENATRLVLLEPASLELLRNVDPRFADKAVVIPQSASAAHPSEDAAEAARLLPDDSGVHVIQWGDALEESFAEEATRETKENRRYDWIGPVSHRQSLLQLQQCDVMVLSSHFEGGPAVPIIAHEITATRGLLGKDYPGFYRNADRQQLADLMFKAEQDPSFLKLLSDCGDGLKGYFAESTESKAIEKLITALG